MKKRILTLIFTLFIIYCILFPKEMAQSTSSGLALWYQNVVPTLLPFSIFSYIIIYSNLYHAFFLKLKRMLPKFSFEQLELLYPFFFGFLFGFPIGAKLLADLYQTGHMKSIGLTKYVASTNHFGPAFIINYIGISQLQSLIPGWQLLFAIYFPAIVLFLGCFSYDYIATKQSIYVSKDKKTKAYSNIGTSNKSTHKEKPASRSYINMQILDTGIINGFETMLRIAGYIVLFSILSGAIHQLLGHVGLLSLVTGMLEVTTGVHQAASALPLEVCMPLICGIVSFGGLCGLFQTKSILKNCPFHMTSYFLLKLCCAGCSTLIGAILWHLA